MSGKVLVVEDEADLRSVIEYNLSQAGFHVVGAGGGWEALRAVARDRPDLVVLDLMLPDFPGTQVCRELGDDPTTADIPILILTAKGEERSRVVGFEIGADDYVVKPVSMRELVLRVGAILRRRGGRAVSVGSPAVERDCLEAGPLRLDLAAHQAYAAGTPVDLSPLEFRLLALLMERSGRLQTRERLLEDVWEQREAAPTRTVDTHIRRLRAKLGAHGSRIETVRGEGYRLAREE